MRAATPLHQDGTCDTSAASSPHPGGEPERSVLSMDSAAGYGVSGSGSVGMAGLEGAGELSAVGCAARVEVARSVFAAAAAYGLEEAWQWKPLLTGPQVGRDSVNAACELLHAS